MSRVHLLSLAALLACARAFEDSSPPHQEVPAKEVAAAEGGAVTLRCRFHDKPPPKITWKFRQLAVLPQDDNVGIQYEYSVPNNSGPPTDKRYNWVHEQFTPCSATCGGGFQTRDVTCRSREELEIVDDSLCDEGLKPPTNQSCNPDSCPAQWVEGPWGECSQRCGSGGVRSREVACQKIFANGQNSIVPDKECFDLLGPKPEVFQKCNEDAPCPMWLLGRWRPCDKRCGAGKQTRLVVCYQENKGRPIELLDDENCTEEKPVEEKPCIMQPCEVDWMTSSWYGCDTCTSKFRTRMVVCATENGLALNESYCSHFNRPAGHEACNKDELPNCEVQWYTTHWSKCSVNCGEGVQSRKVFCGMYYDDKSGAGVKMVDAAECANLTKHSDTIPCSVPKDECPSQWFAGTWSECSAHGEQFRRVMCFQGKKKATDCAPALNSVQPCKPSPGMLAGSPQVVPPKELAAVVSGSEVTINGNAGRHRLLSDGALQIVSLYRNDTGVYFCVADNGLGVAKQEIHLVVNDPVRMPAEKDTVVTGEVGSPLQVRCPTNGYPSPSVKWYRSNGGNTLLHNDSVYEPRANLLLIRTLNIDILGMYTCESNDGVGQAASWKVVVQAYLPDGLFTDNVYLVPRDTTRTQAATTTETITTTTLNPVRMPAEKDTVVTGEVGSPLQVRCPTNGYPSPSVKWYRSNGGNTLLHNDSVYEPRANLLLIRTLNIDILGMYTCESNDGVGQAASWKVVVQAYLPDGLFTDNVYLVPRDTTRTQAATTTETITTTTLNPVRMPAEDTVVTGEVGSPLQVRCPTNGYPSPSVKWYRSNGGNTLLHNDSVYEPRANLLLIRTLNIDILGMYTCESNDGVGQAASWKVVVQAHMPDGLFTDNVYLVPRDTTRTQAATTTETITTTTLNPVRMPAEDTVVTGEVGSPLQVRCPTNGYPSPSVKWYRSNGGNTLLHNDSVYEPRANLLLIRTLNIDILGMYTCESNDGVGQAASWKVVVQAYLPDGLFTDNVYLVPRDTTRTQAATTTETITTTTLNPVRMPAEDTVVTGEVGSPLQVRCPTNGYPSPSVKWYRSNGVNTLLHNDSVYEPRANLLLIRTLNIDILGMYTCESNDGVGQAASWKVVVQAYLPDGLFTDNVYLVPRDTTRTQAATTTETITTTTLKTAEAPKPVTGFVCQYTLYGCCPDNVTIAQGPNNQGCGCQYTEHGCWPDRHTAVSGPNNEGCACNTYQFGCCGDGETPATGPDGAGCDCSSSQHGCCPDGRTEATGAKFLGCTDAPENKQAVCSMSTDPGPCNNFSAIWYHDLEYGGCSRFWYGGCDGNGNKFHTKDECENVCVHPSPPKDACKLPSVKGACDEDNQRWHYNSTREQCIPFRYGGCLGNANNFNTREDCQMQCEPITVADQCSQPFDQGSCAGNYSRWGFNSEAHRCEQFIWGGCEGNSNRFSSEAACQMCCAGTQPHVPPATEVPAPESGTVTLRCLCHVIPPPKNEQPTIDETPSRNRVMTDGALEMHLVVNASYLEGFPGSCSTSPHGCCQDNKTPAHGPEFEGCCLLQAFGCCPDNRKPAEGPHLEGCECKDALYGCCPDNVNIAQGPDNQGCGCQYTEHGCCPNRHTAASGPDYKGCACNTYQFGCCADGITTAKGPEQEGCHHESNASVCSCSSSQHGCCPDGCTAATGPKFLGCPDPDTPENKQARCTQPQEAGNCTKKEAVWSFSQSENRCLPFYYSGCGGNDNRFSSREACAQTCPSAYVPDKCTLPVAYGQCSNYTARWFYNTTERRCRDFRYSGCGGNENNFATEVECLNSCSEIKTTTITSTTTTTASPVEPQPQLLQVELDRRSQSPGSVVSSASRRGDVTGASNDQPLKKQTSLN